MYSKINILFIWHGMICGYQYNLWNVRYFINEMSVFFRKIHIYSKWATRNILNLYRYKCFTCLMRVVVLALFFNPPVIVLSLILGPGVCD